MKGRLSPIHRPDIVRGHGRPRPATVGLPVDEVHSPQVHYSRPSTPPALDRPAKSYDEQPTPILRTRTGRAIHRPKRYVQFISPTH